MLPAVRRAKIIELLRHRGAAGLSDMSAAVGVSVSTLRRDVDYLCAQGHLERTHGGAVLHEVRRARAELDGAIASNVESAAKAAIGLHAAALIEAGQTVIIDSGTTTAAAARAARDRGVPFTAITNDFTIAAILAASGEIRVLVTGGMVRVSTSTILGTDTLRSIGRLRADLALVGTHAISQTELSDTSVELADLKQAMIAATDRPVLLADSTKLFSRSFCSFARLSDLDRLITDTRLTAEQRSLLEQGGLKVETVAIGTAPL